jgi:hypothetical protein
MCGKVKLFDAPFLPRGGLKNERGDVFGLLAIEPRRAPKWCNLPIGNCDSSGGIKEAMSASSQRFPIPHPKLLRGGATQTKAILTEGYVQIF